MANVRSVSDALQRSTLQLTCALFLGLMAAMPALAQPESGPSPAAGALAITVGESVIPLNGPWRFHTGDDPRWAGAAFDDSAWETVDLTPKPGAHDPDVGLTGYVAGWAARGHPRYSGYAWYRMRVSVNAHAGVKLSLAGPLEVNDTYQLFVNGRLLGSSGRFEGPTPVVYNTRPQVFSLTDVSGPGGTSLLIAFRVWAAAGSVAGSRDAGGIRIAPALGEAGAIADRHRLEWLAKFVGYVVDAAEALSFLLLALMLAAVALFNRSGPGYRWFGLALVLSAMSRANQAVFFWTQLESARVFVVVRFVLLDPLVLGAWAMAWRGWFRISRPAWLPAAIGLLTSLYLATHVITAWAFFGSPLSPRLGSFVRMTSSSLRLLFVLVMACLLTAAIARRLREEWLGVVAMLLLSIGLFAQELSTLRIPGIWFPFGVGVSRTQYAYAAFVVVLFVALFRRLASFARPAATKT